jgi:L-glyceraldehyde 3-phosphate reductase
VPLLREGKALYVGVSNYKGEQFLKSVEVAKQHDWAPVTIHQPFYSIMNRQIESDLLPHTAGAGTGVIVFRPLAQGVLTDRYLNGLPPDSRMGKRGEGGRKWYERQKAAGVWDKVAALREIAKARGQTIAQMAITWILRDDRITSVLTGASRVEQITENLEAVRAEPLTAEEIQKIEQILRG